MEVRLEQSSKAELPMDVTLLGMIIEVRSEQPSKAPFPMDVTLLGIRVFEHPTISSLSAVLMMALQSFRES